jgi:lipopolysaccharide assembly outer membrane protein LptD (OstA)
MLALLLGGPGWPGVCHAAQGEAPFEVEGDVMPTDAGGDTVEVSGNVRVVRGSFVLTCDHLRYEKKSDSALATGEVEARDGTFVLTCRRLDYRVGQQLAIAWEAPLIRRSTATADGASEVVEMKATRIALDVEGNRVEGLDRVELTRWVETGGRRTLDVRVRCDEMELDQSVRSCLFRGNVEIETVDLGARARRAFLEEPLDRLTLIGGAEAWSVGPGGEKIDRVSGTKILHFLKGKRTLVFGGVSGRMKVSQ